MSLAVILEIILGFLKFPSEVSAFIRLISKSPDQKRQEIVSDIQSQLKSFEETGRPS
jgi:hypothetical protein